MRCVLCGESRRRSICLYRRRSGEVEKLERWNVGTLERWIRTDRGFARLFSNANIIKSLLKTCTHVGAVDNVLTQRQTLSVIASSRSTMDSRADGGQRETTEVIICGCGPTGAMLSALLSRLGVDNICLDRAEDIVTDPRGIALDEDGIRALQATGIQGEIYSEMGRCIEVFNFIGSSHSDLNRSPFLRMDIEPSQGGTGHVGAITHKQPILEKHLRRKMAGKFSQLRTSCTLTSIDEDDDRVYATYEDTSGIGRQLQAKFLVGADGKTGFHAEEIFGAQRNPDETSIEVRNRSMTRFVSRY